MTKICKLCGLSEPIAKDLKMMCNGSRTGRHTFEGATLKRSIEAIDGKQEDLESAPNLLKRAADLMKERGKQYDKPEGERSMARAVYAFNAITGRDLKEAEGWLLLQVLKDVRQWQRPEYHADSAEDCIAYAALKAEALAHD